MVNVVFHTAFVGDLLLSIPLLRELKRLDPAKPVVLVCRPGLAEFFLKNKIVDQVIELKKTDSDSVEAFRRTMAGLHIDKLICVHESYRSAWMLKSVSAKTKISFKHWWNKLFFDVRVERPMHLPEAVRALHLLAPLDEKIANQLREFDVATHANTGLPEKSISSWPYKIPDNFKLLTSPDRGYVATLQERFKIRKPYALIAPSSQWATKRWTNSGFIEVMSRLSQQGLNIYLIGTPVEKDHCAQLVSEAKGAELAAQAQRVNRKTHVSANAETRSLAGATSLAELHGLMSEAEVVVTNDSGPMHMATAADRPVVAIFGPTTLELGYRPWSDRSYVAQTELSCRPCGKHGHNKCPIGTHDCMKKVSAEEVLRGIDHVRK